MCAYDVTGHDAKTMFLLDQTIDVMDTYYRDPHTDHSITITVDDLISAFKVTLKSTKTDIVTLQVCLKQTTNYNTFYY